MITSSIAILSRIVISGHRHILSLLVQTLWSPILRAAKDVATPFSPAFVAPSEQRGAGQGKDIPVTSVLATAIMASQDTEEEHE
jgi:hypothetical protein